MIFLVFICQNGENRTAGILLLLLFIKEYKSSVTVWVWRLRMKNNRIVYLIKQQQQRPLENRLGTREKTNIEIHIILLSSYSRRYNIPLGVWRFLGGETGLRDRIRLTGTIGCGRCRFIFIVVRTRIRVNVHIQGVCRAVGIFFFFFNYHRMIKRDLSWISVFVVFGDKLYRQSWIFYIAIFSQQIRIVLIFLKNSVVKSSILDHYFINYKPYKLTRSRNIFSKINSPNMRFHEFKLEFQQILVHAFLYYFQDIFLLSI